MSFSRMVLLNLLVKILIFEINRLLFWCWWFSINCLMFHSHILFHHQFLSQLVSNHSVVSYGKPGIRHCFWLRRSVRPHFLQLSVTTKIYRKSLFLWGPYFFLFNNFKFRVASITVHICFVMSEFFGGQGVSFISECFLFLFSVGNIYFFQDLKLISNRQLLSKWNKFERKET